MQSKQLLTDESTATRHCLHAVDLKDPMAVIGTVFRSTSMNVCYLGISVDLRMVVFTPGVRQPSAVVLGRSSRPTDVGNQLV
jgi:hypothetical protein